jgi:hypothetical protein
MMNDPINIAEMRDLADCCPQRCHEALLWGADEIERLTRENERLEAKWRLEGDAYIEAKDEIERLRAALEKYGDHYE